MYNPIDIKESGWGIIFPEDQDKSILDNLRPLLSLRREQARERYREFKYFPYESKYEFCLRNGIIHGAFDPQLFPYYIMIVGSPEIIPFEFQYQLDVTFAVGRLWFDMVDMFKQYAISVCNYEESSNTSKRVLLYGTDADDLTSLSRINLVEPIKCFIEKKFPDWGLKYLVKESAYKEQLISAFSNSKEKPDFIFSASHGMQLSDCNFEKQLNFQGSLVCQDWSGDKNDASVSHCFTSDDLCESLFFNGLIAFLFSCYSAGTPGYSEFSRENAGQKKSYLPFVSKLTQSLMSHINGSTLAVIGHVDLTFSNNFLHEKAGPQLSTFKKVIFDLLNGKPVGYAAEALNRRYAEITSDLDYFSKYHNLTKENEWIRHELELAKIDARNFIVLGDPFVRFHS